MENVIVTIRNKDRMSVDIEVPTDILLESIISGVCIELELDAKKYVGLKHIREKVILQREMSLVNATIYDGDILELME